MGSSFGADLSMLLLHSPYLSANIIEGAIICSGFPRIGDGKTKIQTEKVVEVLGCHVDENNTTLSANETFGCIREKSTEEISQATFEVDDLASYWGPRFDRHLLPANDHGQLLEMWKVSETITDDSFLASEIVDYQHSQGVHPPSVY